MKCEFVSIVPHRQRGELTILTCKGGYLDYCISFLVLRDKCVVVLFQRKNKMAPFDLFGA